MQIQNWSPIDIAEVATKLKKIWCGMYIIMLPSALLMHDRVELQQTEIIDMYLIWSIGMVVLYGLTLAFQYIKCEEKFRDDNMMVCMMQWLSTDTSRISILSDFNAKGKEELDAVKLKYRQLATTQTFKALMYSTMYMAFILTISEYIA